ncbi:hypothetical protein HNR60_000686 [Rhodopseudomonas rhenobacensis]|uniref:Uncharacterized protein n=1 Tax=Rhodopseudomonas rhenobacensis TaxID=87461 RepID=A0A7W8DYJ7_9BRAD|nr:hypothetical protein [Rhodopseudomonas rhenobacensis]
MWRQVSSTVRFWATRIQCLILAETCSIGLRSGEYGAVPQPGAGVSDQPAHGRQFIAAQIFHDDDVAWLQHRHELLLDIGTEAVAVDWLSNTQGAVSWSQRSAPRKVSVRQWPCGAKPRSRSPLRPQPRNGAMLVLIQVSSMTPGALDRGGPVRRANGVVTAPRQRGLAQAGTEFFEPQPLAPQDRRTINPCRDRSLKS